MKYRHLITGASGLVGTHVVLQLVEQGALEVHCTVHSNDGEQRLLRKLSKEGVSADKITIHTIDLEHYAQVRDLIARIAPDVVYHTAARVALDTTGASQDEKMVSSNVDMTHFVCEAMLEHKSAQNADPLLVHISSVAAFGTFDPRGTIDENTPFTDIAHASAYARSKFLSQNEVQRASKLGLRTVTVNPSVIIGLNDGRGQMQRLFSLIERGVPFYTDGAMGYVDVRDVASAMVLLSEKNEQTGEIYCLNGANLTFREFITIFGSPLARLEPRIRLPRGLVTTIGGMSRLLGRKLVGKNTVRYLNAKAAYDGSKIVRASNGCFNYTPIEETAIYIAKNLDK